MNCENFEKIIRLQKHLSSKCWMRKFWMRSVFFLMMILYSDWVHAGVFNLPHFVVPGEFAIGIEPEIFFSGGANVGSNFRFTQGVSEMSNLMALIGTGTGSRGFRVGGAITFDIFPDIVDQQPGIGLAFQGLFVQLPSAGSVEVTATPYIHKTFNGDSSPFEPFVAVPLGLILNQDQIYQTMSTLAFGVIFEHSNHFRSVVELGIGMSNTSTYFSGGIVYYH